MLATPDAYHKHDVSFNIKDSRYPLILTNDLGRYLANYNTRKGQAIASLRDAIHQSNFYCNAIHHLKVDKLSMFKNVHFSSSYAPRQISDILELYFKTKRYHHQAMFKSSKFEVGKVLARLKEIEDRQIGFRFESPSLSSMSADPSATLGNGLSTMVTFSC